MPKPFYSPIFFQDNDYYVISDMLDNQPFEQVIEYAAQWDYSEEITDNLRDTISDYPHEWELGPSAGGYWLVESKAFGYAYLVRENTNNLERE